MKKETAWLIVFVLCLSSAVASLLFDRADLLVPCGIPPVFAILSGIIGGRAREWRVTASGVVLSALVFFSSPSDPWAFRLAPLTLIAPLALPMLAYVAFPLLLAGLAFCAYGFTIALRREPGPGLCAKCQYDLQGNTSGICPECGTKAAPVPEGVAK
jgi:hypothetical protein